MTFNYRCNPNTEFRTITGICNNLEHPMWGSMSTPFRRFVAAQYADGSDVPRGGLASASGHCTTGGDHNSTDPCVCFSDPKALLPNPREVSITLHPEENRPDTRQGH